MRVTSRAAGGAGGPIVAVGGAGGPAGGIGGHATSALGGAGESAGGVGERVTSPAGGAGERGTRGFAPNGFSSTADSRSRTREDIARGPSESATPRTVAPFLGTVVISSHAHFTSLEMDRVDLTNLLSVFSRNARESRSR